MFIRWLAGLTLAVDCANGAPEMTALRGALVADAASRVLALNENDAAAAVYGALFRYLGCTSYAHEDAQMFGDEHEAARLLASLEPSDYLAISHTVASRLGLDEPVLDRTVRLLRLAVSGRSFRRGYEASQCEGASLLASRLDVATGVGEVVATLFERWDGTGGPAGLAQTEIPTAARVVHLARETTVQFVLRGGRPAVEACLAHRAGKQLDPRMCRALLASEDFHAAFEAPLDDLATPVLERHLAHAFVAVPSLDTLAEVFGDFADQKSPWFLGHARRVAELLTDAASERGLDEATTALLIRAAWLHDIGRVGIANRTWAVPGPLAPLDWEKVRLHPYIGERICRHLDPKLAALVGRHHERADGSGYPHAQRPDAVASMLAAADVWVALGADRPHRPRLDDDARTELLHCEAREGRLDADAVRVILSVSGDRRASVRPNRSLLSYREREVLLHVARGLSNKEVATVLGISPRTVQAHTLRIYDKLGVRTRAGASLRAGQLGLLDP